MFCAWFCIPLERSPMCLMAHYSELKRAHFQLWLGIYEKRPKFRIRNSTIYYILYTIPYYTLLYSTLLYSTLFCYTILYYTISYHIIPYYTISYYTILRCLNSGFGLLLLRFCSFFFFFLLFCFLSSYYHYSIIVIIVIPEPRLPDAQDLCGVASSSGFGWLWKI